eukprot:TRINITY_DN810_c0_g1_i1.p1 TRINITY_DN810_c0_g1~~TRINITY_DN810_c0_g1_i1.p1  ORF type:complete len:481 (+),score=99.93 TRINITY_DN810_c0_g1_i1:229-1671(+)
MSKQPGGTTGRHLVRILAVDGGGIRGLLSAAILREIEKAAGRPIGDLFDLTAGTSTGALIALMTALPLSRRKTAAEMVEMYREEGHTLFIPRRQALPQPASSSPKLPPIDQAASASSPTAAPAPSPVRGFFSGAFASAQAAVAPTVGRVSAACETARNTYPAQVAADTARLKLDAARGVVEDVARTAAGVATAVTGPRYRTEGLEGMFERVGGELTLSDCRLPIVVPAYEVSVPLGPYVFSSLDAKRDLRRDFLLKQVARATTAAPTYFRPVVAVDQRMSRKLTFIDGGVVANNPALVALTSAQAATKLPQDEYDVLIVSIGTGRVVVKPLDAAAVSEWGVAHWVAPLIDIALDGSAVLAERTLSMMAGGAAVGDDDGCPTFGFGPVEGDDEGPTKSSESSPNSPSGPQRRPLRVARFNPQLTTATSSMDDVSPANLTALLHLAQEYCEQPAVAARIKSIATELTNVSATSVAAVASAWR